MPLRPSAPPLAWACPSWVYEAVVAVHFTATADEKAAFKADPDNHWIPTYSPEESGLTVEFFNSRWFASWWQLDAPEDLPEPRRRELVRVVEDTAQPFGVTFHEV